MVLLLGMGYRCSGESYGGTEWVVGQDETRSDMSISTLLQNEFECLGAHLNPEAQPFISNSPVIDSTQANNPIKLSPDALTTLKNIRINNLKNVIIG